MIRRVYPFVLLVLSLMVSSCKDSSSQPVEILRFDQAAMNSVDGQIDSLYAPAVSAIKYLFGAGELSDSEFVEAYTNAGFFDTFSRDVAQRLPDLSEQMKRLGAVKVNADALGRIDFPKVIYGYITPYNQSVVYVDSIALIGLNHYLGADYEGYSGLDAYRRQLKDADRISWDVAESLLAIDYPYQPQSPATVLSRLLYEGALINAMLYLQESDDLAAALGYDKDQIDWANENERAIWRQIVGGDMLFNSDVMIAEKLVSPSPATTIVNPNAPGRIGRYIGYEIVKSYLDKNPDASLEFLLSPEFYCSPDILEKAVYNP